MSELLAEYTDKEKALAGLAMLRSGKVDVTKTWMLEQLTEDEAKVWLENARFWIDCLGYLELTKRYP